MANTRSSDMCRHNTIINGVKFKVHNSTLFLAVPTVLQSVLLGVTSVDMN